MIIIIQNSSRDLALKGLEAAAVALAFDQELDLVLLDDTHNSEFIRKLGELSSFGLTSLCSPIKQTALPESISCSTIEMTDLKRMMRSQEKVISF